MDLKKIIELAESYSPITMNDYSNGNLNGGKIKIYELNLKTGEITVFDGTVTTGIGKNDCEYYARKENSDCDSFSVKDPNDYLIPYKSFSRIISPSLEGLCRGFCDFTFLFNQSLTKLLENESV